MKNENDFFKKICSFYVSEWHLATMILPYLNKKIDEKIKIKTILEKDIQENIETLLSKLNLKNEKEFLEINWRKTKVIKYSEFENNMLKQINENSNIIILTNGTKKYINSVNKNVSKFIEKNIDEILKRKANISIINCYEVTEFNENLNEILDEHDLVLNTSGEKQIEEVFEGYEKKQII